MFTLINVQYLLHPSTYENQARLLGFSHKNGLPGGFERFTGILSFTFFQV
jgi:hypothetical protein